MTRREWIETYERLEKHMLEAEYAGNETEAERIAGIMEIFAASHTSDSKLD